MAERIQVELVDDIDGSEAQQTVTFAMDGVSYEIDLSEQNARSLRELFGPYIKQARTAQQQTKRRQTRKQEKEERQARQANRQLTEEIRGAARRTRQRYQQERHEEESAPTEVASGDELDRDTLLERPLSFSPSEAKGAADQAARSEDVEDDEQQRFPVVSLPQFSSANE
ncbi:Lsr2 protein [Actinopolyspora xinjiangensis]|uniref:Lsr2 protein n=1 Tax=Actinopolyspora xinjiangensis TaxID=405564 RepID=A0A1H0W478_9ACTN|nr:Lsr2 family protein [Actinopolyspora xinjiangensis]SDP85522.1 Lsr2 protein [Actinopolyspora xinjiangensis]